MDPWLPARNRSEGTYGDSFACPECNSTDLRKVSLVYEQGVYKAQGVTVGFLLGSRDGFSFTRKQGRTESLLSKRLAPPAKLPYLSPLLAWLVGPTIVMALAGRGQLSWIMGALSFGYLLLAPAFLLASLLYNLALRPKKLDEWNRKFFCQRCGTLVKTPV